MCVCVYGGMREKDRERKVHGQTTKKTRSRIIHNYGHELFATFHNQPSKIFFLLVGWLVGHVIIIIIKNNLQQQKQVMNAPHKLNVHVMTGSCHQFIRIYIDSLLSSLPTK